MRRPARTTLIPGRGKRPVQVERTPLQGFLARKAVLEAQTEVWRGTGSRDGGTAVGEALSEPTAASTAPLAREIGLLLQHDPIRFPHSLISDEAGAR